MSVSADLKTFLTQANFVTLAVAFVLGLQISAVVSALVTDIVDPAIGVFFKTNLTNAALVTVNGSTFSFGAFLGAVLNFVIILLVLFFLMVEPFAIHAKRVAAKAAAVPPTTKTCPYCFSTINIQSTKCAFCTSSVPATPAPAAVAPASN